MVAIRVRLAYRWLGACLGLLLLAAVNAPAPAGASRTHAPRSTKAGPRFPLACNTILTPRAIAKIVKRHVVPGRTSDVDPHTSLCYYGTYPHATDDLSVTVDAFSPAYTAMKEAYPLHKVEALGAFGNNIAVVSSKQDTEVVALYGSWFLDVKGFAGSATQTFKPSQVMAIARRAYMNVIRPRSGNRPVPNLTDNLR